MKRFAKTLLCFLTIAALLSIFFVVNVSAASTTIAFSTNTVKPGDNVAVTIRVNGDEEIYSASISLTYNTSILKYVSGADVSSGNQLKIEDNSTQGNKLTYTINFTAVTEGSATFSATSVYSGISLNEVTKNASATLTVKNSSTPATTTTPTAPSNNANLSALTVDGGTLTPAFSKNVTEYTVTVENTVASTNINATASAKGAKISGTGATELLVGENEKSVVVTAPDGKTQKTYKILIKRASVEETLAINPTTTIIDGQLATIKTDISDVTVPNGFTPSTAVYNGVDVGVLKTEDGKYTLYSITNSQNQTTDYYVYKELRDEFERLSYMMNGNNMYIFADFPEGFVIPKGYYETALQIANGDTVTALCSEDEALKDIYFIYCYFAGSEQFFSYDTSDLSIQRSPDLTVAVNNPEFIPGGIKGIIYKFNALEGLTKTLAIALIGAVVLIIVLIIVVCVLASRTRMDGAHSGKFFGNDDEIEDFLRIDENFNFNYQLEESQETEEETIE